MIKANKHCPKEQSKWNAKSESRKAQWPSATQEAINHAIESFKHARKLTRSAAKAADLFSIVFRDDGLQAVHFILFAAGQLEAAPIVL